MIRWLIGAVAFLALLPGSASGQVVPTSSNTQVAAPTIVTDREKCEALAGDRFMHLPGAATYITTAELREANADRPAACYVEGYVNPSDLFGILLPLKGWNGRYMVRGCGGSCGKLAVEFACARHVRDGFACLHTDMGHRSTLVDNNWVPGNLQGLVDFGYRATHVTTLAGRAIIKAFYATDPDKSYFFACSTGGRQALIEAQRFPDDFDGIIAMAPASMAPFGDRKPATISDVNIFNTEPSGRPILPNRKLLLLHRAVLKACDASDGIADGLISAPLSCGFRPAQLLCRGSDIANCLTAAQVAVVEKLYAWRGALPGSELDWIGTLIPDAPLPGEAWQPIPDLGADRGDPATIETMVAPNDPDLRPFRDHGGKLILVQGLADAIVMPPPTLDYYQTMTRTMGGAEQTRPFARLFLIPGMEHCSGGDGAWAINYVAALRDWTEHGKAPESLRGIHPDPAARMDYFSTRLPDMDPKYIQFARDHHAWPGPSLAAPGLPVLPPKPVTKPLVVTLGEVAGDAEQSGMASGYARRSVLNQMLTALWGVLETDDSGIVGQRAALAQLVAQNRSPLTDEAARRLQVELDLD